jgi:hypothetical protein
LVRAVGLIVSGSVVVVMGLWFSWLAVARSGIRRRAAGHSTNPKRA